MRLIFKNLLIGVVLCLSVGLKHAWVEPLERVEAAAASPFGAALMVGRIQNARLVECSGMDASRVNNDLFWAINDGGNGPYLYAMGEDGRDRGRVRLAGAKNRDWEGLDTFMWHDRPMILIADVGDNHQRFGQYVLYVVEEPPLDDARLDTSAVIDVAWRIDFTYPDRNHDAEGVAVDPVNNEVLILTKRDEPPRLFALPLKATSSSQLAVARQVAIIDRIPPPTIEDRQQPYGNYRSQPTALDLSGNGLLMAVLTYKHAYLFQRRPGEPWAKAFATGPALVPLPLPQAVPLLRQREAICFSMDGSSLLVSSEGEGAGIFRLTLR
jgi:hypothetical protein